MTEFDKRAAQIAIGLLEAEIRELKLELDRLLGENDRLCLRNFTLEGKVELLERIIAESKRRRASVVVPIRRKI